MEPQIEILGSSASLNSDDSVIVCHDPASTGPFHNHCFVRIKSIRRSILLHLEADHIFTVTPENFIYISETNVIFFRSSDQWGVINLVENELLIHISAPSGPIIWRSGDVLIVEDDLTAWSCDLHGRLIHKVPIDPPSEATEFIDHIEYNSPVFGKQLLRTKRSINESITPFIE